MSWRRIPPERNRNAARSVPISAPSSQAPTGAGSGNPKHRRAERVPAPRASACRSIVFGLGHRQARWYGHRPTMLADLDGRPPSGPAGTRQPGCGDPRVLMSPRSLRAPRARAPQAVLAPPQDHWPAETREVDQLDHRAVLDPRPLTTTRTDRVHHDRLDRHLEPTNQRLDHVHDVHIGQSGSDQQLARVRSVEHSRGTSGSDWRRTPSDPQGPCYPTRTLTPRPNAKSAF